MKQLQKRLLILLGSLICFIVVFSSVRSIIALWYKRDIVKEREEALKRVQAQNEKLKAQLLEVQSPFFIEREARNKLGLAREGEAVVLIPDKLQETNESRQNNSQKSKGSNWKLWWGLFF